MPPVGAAKGAAVEAKPVVVRRLPVALALVVAAAWALAARVAPPKGDAPALQEQA
jgi:hypothetical protein